MTAESVADARRRFAEELRTAAQVTSPCVVNAFATVPRERFVGEGPWRILSPTQAADYRMTPDADPRQPSLWARLYDELRLAPGSRVVHVGAGTGYYTASWPRSSARKDA